MKAIEEFASDIRETKKQWKPREIFGLLFLHAAAVYVLFLMLSAAIPKFSYQEWGVAGLFCGMSAIGALILTITNHYHHGRYRGKVVDGRYQRKNIPRKVQNFDIAGLLNVAIGLCGAFSLLFFFSFSEFHTGIWILGALLLAISGFGVTIGYHRYATHRSFECGPVFSTALLFAGAMSLQGHAIKWATDHIIHHARTEIEQKDPHSPVEGFWRSHMGWIIRPYVYSPKIRETFSRGFQNDKKLLAQKKYFGIAGSFGILIPFAIFGIWGLWNSGEFNVLHGLQQGFEAFLFAGLFRLVLLLHITWSVNSFSHTWGPHEYESEITGDSTDVWMLAPFSFGENMQNIHHLFPSIAYYGDGTKWYHKLDISGLLIIALSKLNHVKALRWIGFPSKVKRIGEAQRRYMMAHMVKRPTVVQGT